MGIYSQCLSRLLTGSYHVDYRHRLEFDLLVAHSWISFFLLYMLSFIDCCILCYKIISNFMLIKIWAYFPVVLFGSYWILSSGLGFDLLVVICWTLLFLSSYGILLVIDLCIGCRKYNFQLLFPCLSEIWYKLLCENACLCTINRLNSVMFCPWVSCLSSIWLNDFHFPKVYLDHGLWLYYFDNYVDSVICIFFTLNNQQKGRIFQFLCHIQILLG